MQFFIVDLNLFMWFIDFDTLYSFRLANGIVFITCHHVSILCGKQIGRKENTKNMFLSIVLSQSSTLESSLFKLAF